MFIPTIRLTLGKRGGSCCWDTMARIKTFREITLWGCCPLGSFTRIRIYARLKAKYRLERLYILSAGWGLIRAEFSDAALMTLPSTTTVEPYKCRRGLNGYDDWRMLPDDTTEPIVFFGGRKLYRACFVH